MTEPTHKVYVKVDAQGRILRCEGGCTMANITDITQWTLIDEGNEARHIRCQVDYFAGGLYEEHGIPRYKLVDGQAVERTAEEIAADIAAIPAPPPTVEQRLAALNEAIAEHDTLIIYMTYETITQGLEDDENAVQSA